MLVPTKTEVYSTLDALLRDYPSLEKQSNVLYSDLDHNKSGYTARRLHPDSKL